MYFDMAISAKTTGWLAIGFYGANAKKDHGMMFTDIISGWVDDKNLSNVLVQDRWAIAAAYPSEDNQQSSGPKGSARGLTGIQGQQVNGASYLRFRRSFAPEDLDACCDFNFTNNMERVSVVFAYSSVNSDTFSYHGPTRGFGKLAWNMNCSNNFYWSLLSSSCLGCDPGYYP